MNAEQVLTIHDTIRGSLTGTMNFPQILGKLHELGIERYHCDYTRQEITYYHSNGQSLVVTVPMGEFPTGREFLADDVAAAVKQSQRGEHTFVDFVRSTMAAGCVGYFVQLTGRKVQYFGRTGDCHTEHFPAPT